MCVHVHVLASSRCELSLDALVFARALVGHRIQEEVGRTGDQTGSAGPGPEHGVRGRSLGNTFPCKTRNLFVCYLNTASWV